MTAIFDYVRQAFKNPIFLFIFTIFLGATVLYSFDGVIVQGNIWSKLIESIVVATITAGTIGLLIEVIGRTELIEQAVHSVVGQVSATKLGIKDIKEKTSEINYKDDILYSQNLVIGYRRSVSFLNRHKGEISTRMIHNGKSVDVVYMKNDVIFPDAVKNSFTAEDIFGEIENRSGKKLNGLYNVFHTQSNLSYNFVRCDRGIWIKLYFNAASTELPPAFFVSAGSTLYRQYAADIDKILDNAEKSR